MKMVYVTLDTGIIYMAPEGAEVPEGATVSEEMPKQMENPPAPVQEPESNNEEVKEDDNVDARIS